MHGTFTLGKPIVGVLAGVTGMTTLPSGASVEVRHNAQATLVQVKWQLRYFEVHLPDLLDACSVAEVTEITWPGSGRSSGAAE